METTWLTEAELHYRQSCDADVDTKRELHKAVISDSKTSVRYRFGSPFSSKRLCFVDTVL